MTGLVRTGLVVLILASSFRSTAAWAQGREAPLLGLTPGATIPTNFWEGRTDYRLFVRPKGEVKAVMLFARFPDAEAEESTQDLYDRLVPGAVDYFKKASFSGLNLTVDARHRWIAMDQPSIRYDCTKWEPHKAYVSEVVRKARDDVDFSKFQIVYIVGSKNKGTPISPTWRAWPGDGVRAGKAEVRHAVTFGNDCRNANHGWKTLVHETGHVFGLPDLYDFHPASGAHKDIYRDVGCWDFMSWHPSSNGHLAWHKLKLGWLSDRNFAVVRRDHWNGLVTPGDAKDGVKAVVVPVRNSAAYVAEVRSLDGRPGSESGVLCYKVSLLRGTGEGPIRVFPAKADDGNRESEKRFGTLYNALVTAGQVPTEVGDRVKIEVLGREGQDFRVQVTR